MTNKTDHLIILLSKEIRLFLGSSFGVFLFVLFFQPFPLDRFDLNNSLLFVGGLGVIVFVFMAATRISISFIVRNKLISNFGPALVSFIGGAIILVLSSVSFAFYLHYVGGITLSFYIIFKVSLICLIPVIVLRLFDIISTLKQNNEDFIIEKAFTQKRIEKYQEDYQSKSVEFISDSNTDKLNLLISDVIFIKSANNYVEIIYVENDIIKNKLIRNTLTHIEHQLKPFSNFFRCHRICIVNVYYIEKLNSKQNNYFLVMKGLEEQVPVSRQYLLKIKEALG